MGDLQSPRWMAAKAALLLCCGVIAAGQVLLESPTLRTALLLAVSVWGFCRAYFFAFSVIEHYIDPGFRFAGLLSVAAYWWRRRRG